MDNEEAKKMIMERFLKDSILFKDDKNTAYGFNKVLSQSIRQYTPNCWESIIAVDDSVKEDNVRLCQYVLNKGKIESDEIRLNPEGILALKTALSNYNIMEECINE